MPSIVIKEVNETTIGLPANSTDVVYVPGFTSTNTNYLIYAVSGEGPDTYTPGHIAKRAVTDSQIISANKDNINYPLNRPSEFYTGSYPQYACNTVDKITWLCIADQNDFAGVGQYEWVKQDKYIQPYSENVPQLCDSLTDFEDLFGKQPYQFEND